MSRSIVVTLKDNVTQDENGELALINPEIVGHLVKTHPLSAQMINPETNQIQFGVTFKSEVYWEHARTPSPAFEDPNDLAWVSFSDEENVEDETDEEQYDEASFQDENTF